MYNENKTDLINLSIKICPQNTYTIIMLFYHEIMYSFIKTMNGNSVQYTFLEKFYIILVIIYIERMDNTHYLSTEKAMTAKYLQ